MCPTGPLIERYFPEWSWGSSPVRLERLIELDNLASRLDPTPRWTCVPDWREP